MGVKPGERNYETQCSKCYTRFRFKEAEARVVPDQRDGDAVVVKCPVCGKECWVAMCRERWE